LHPGAAVAPGAGRGTRRPRRPHAPRARAATPPGPRIEYLGRRGAVARQPGDDQESRAKHLRQARCPQPPGSGRIREQAPAPLMVADGSDLTPYRESSILGHQLTGDLSNESDDALDTPRGLRVLSSPPPLRAVRVGRRTAADAPAAAAAVFARLGAARGLGRVREEGLRPMPWGS